MKKIVKRVLITLAILFIILNLLIVIQSYSFTHFEENTNPHTQLKSNSEVSNADGIKMFFTGIKIPRPMGNIMPKRNYQDIVISIAPNRNIHGWYIPTDSLSRGTALIFHGYVDNKSSMLAEADEFIKRGFNTILIDFMGSGESYGNQTTMGFLESENVFATYKYAVDSLKEKNILLYGFSMGAAAITKAQHDHPMNISAIILQAPYATFEGTISARVQRMGIPTQPISKLITFWMGQVNGFNGFEANPIEYVSKLKTPTLLMTGAKDINISKEETNAIFDAIGSEKKQLQLFENANHESLLKNDSTLWKQTINKFLIESLY